MQFLHFLYFFVQSTFHKDIFSIPALQAESQAEHLGRPEKKIYIGKCLPEQEVLERVHRRRLGLGLLGGPVLALEDPMAGGGRRIGLPRVQPAGRIRHSGRDELRGEFGETEEVTTVLVRPFSFHQVYLHLDTSRLSGLQRFYVQFHRRGSYNSLKMFGVDAHDAQVSVRGVPHQSRRKMTKPKSSSRLRIIVSLQTKHFVAYLFYPALFAGSLRADGLLSHYPNRPPAVPEVPVGQAVREAVRPRPGPDGLQSNPVH